MLYLGRGPQAEERHPSGTLHTSGHSKETPIECTCCEPSGEMGLRGRPALREVLTVVQPLECEDLLGSEK